MASRSVFSCVVLLCVSFLLITLSGCDSASDGARDNHFTADLEGAVNAEMNGDAVYVNLKGDLLLDVFSNFGILLNDQGVRGDGVYFTRRDTTVLDVGTYPLLDMVSDDAERADPRRVWAFLNVDDRVLYSRSGELIIEEAARGRLVGRFSFQATPLTDTTASTVTMVEGTFEAVPR